MTVRVARVLLALVVGVLASAANAETNDGHSIQETPLANLNLEVETLTIDPTNTEALIQFAIGPTIAQNGGRLVLNLSPSGERVPALFVVLNGSQAVRIEPSLEPISAEIDLPQSVLQPGTNLVTLALEHDEGGGWRVDGTQSRLRIGYETIASIASLGMAEAAMMADFPRLDRIHIADRPNEIMLEAVLAQGAALRMMRTPEFMPDPANADLRIGFDLDADLQGPEIRFGGEDLHIVIAGRHLQELETAARLFASRSMRQAGHVFRVSDALSAAPIGTPTTFHTESESALRGFAQARLPFGAGRGAQTAVVVTEADGEARLAALSILSRTALAHQTAWIYAWYGSDSELAPEDRHAMFIGTGALNDRRLSRGAPPEFRAALRAAAEHAGQQNGLRLSSAAYADTDNVAAGVATVFTDPSNPTRWIAGFTSPQAGGFTRASEILSRSDHWSALAGQAAFWDEDSVTAYDYSVNDQVTLADRYGLASLSPREAAFILFMLAGLFILRGIWRRRRIHNKSTGWR